MGPAFDTPSLRGLWDTHRISMTEARPHSWMSSPPGTRRPPRAHLPLIRAGDPRLDLLPVLSLGPEHITPEL